VCRAMRSDQAIRSCVVAPDDIVSSPTIHASLTCIGHALNRHGVVFDKHIIGSADGRTRRIGIDYAEHIQELHASRTRDRIMVNHSINVNGAGIFAECDGYIGRSQFELVVIDANLRQYTVCAPTASEPDWQCRRTRNVKNKT